MTSFPGASGDGLGEVRRRRLAGVKEEEETPGEKVAKLVQGLDAFTKLPEECQERRASGGGAAVLTFLLMLLLVLSELSSWSEPSFSYEYHVDEEHVNKVRINVDMTIRMRCALIGMDVLDSSGQELQDNGELEEHQVHWNLSPEEQRKADASRLSNLHLTRENHALQELLWSNNVEDKMLLKTPLASSGQPVRPGAEPDSCRVRGHFTVNKVAGNLHVTAGKPFELFGAHAHMSLQMSKNDYNFSHRIHHLSFGEPAAGRIHPLDSTEVVTSENYHMFQYFVKIVPIAVRTRRASVDTYQFAVQEHSRLIDHGKGSHGVPGIFIKYDVSPLTVEVREDSASVWTLLVRLAAGAGGLFATSSVLISFMQFLSDAVCCRLKMGRYNSAPLDLNSSGDTRS